MALDKLRVMVAKAIGGKSMKAATQQNDPWGYLLKGNKVAKERGHDKFGASQKKMLQQLETQRDRDPVLFRAVNYFVQLGLGSGITWTCEDKKLAPIIKAIWRANRLDKAQTEMAIEFATSGNLFSRVPPLKQPAPDSKQVIPGIDTMPTCQIDKIATKDGEVWYYRRVWEELVYPEPTKGVQKSDTAITTTKESRFEDILADEVVHTKMMAGASELRGVSSLQPAAHWSQLYGRTVETVWMAAVARAMFFFHAELEEGGEDALEKFVDAIESQMVTRTDPAGFDYSTVPIGQVLATTGGVKFTALGGDVKGGAVDDEMRRVLLMAATAMGMPEFALSDGNYSNLASAESQSNPFYRLMQSFQDDIIDHITEVLKICLDRLGDAKLLPGVKLADGQDHPIDLVTVNGPDILSKDIVGLGAVLVNMVNADIVSRKRAAEMLGEDWNIIEEQIKAERKAGFTKPTTQPAQQPGGPPGGSMLPFPIDALRSMNLSNDPAKTEDGKPRHPEIYKKMRAIRTGMLDVLDQYRNSLLLAGDDTNEQQAAVAIFYSEMIAKFKELLTVSRETGKESVEDGK